MARLFERNRQTIIDAVSARLIDADDSRAAALVQKICRWYEVPATERDIQDAATEAVRRRLIAKARQLSDNIVLLHETVTAQADEIDALNVKLDQARTAFLALKAKVDSYHP